MKHTIQLSVNHPIQLSVNHPPSRKKRHHWLSVLILSQVLFNLGIILGAIALFLIHRYFPNQSAEIRFVMDVYFPFIGVLIILPGYCAVFDKEVFKRMLHSRKGFSGGNNLRMLLLGYLSGFAANTFCILVAWLHSDLSFSLGEISIPYLLFAFLIVMIQSGAEEVTYRGFMHFALEEHYGIRMAVVINGVLFGLMHLPNDGVTVISFLNISLIGIVYSLCLYCFDSLWFCIANHTAWNFTQNFLFGLPNSGRISEKSWLVLNASKSSLFYDKTFGIEGAFSLLIVLILIIVALTCHIFVKNRLACQTIDS